MDSSSAGAVAMMRAGLLVVVLAVTAACSAVDASPGNEGGSFEPTLADEDALVKAFFDLPYMDPDSLTPSLRADIIDYGLRQCEQIRSNPEQASMTLGLGDAMGKDAGYPESSSEDLFRLSVTYLCPDLADVAEEIIDKTL